MRFKPLKWLKRHRFHRWLQRHKYHELPSTYQSPTAPRPVEKSKWQRCESCGRSIPAEVDYLFRSDGFREEAGTWTYVCPFCSHCHVGTPLDRQEIREQTHCHECGTELGDAYQCPACNFPRGWMRVACPYCGNKQPVYAPHWVIRCDAFKLECVRCESAFWSLCIC
jgi:hypothetical protein